MLIFYGKISQRGTMDPVVKTGNECCHDFSPTTMDARGKWDNVAIVLGKNNCL
jgi:hypothetical protein